MAALPRLRVPVLIRLADQLRFAPPATSRKHLERAEALADLVKPGELYDEDWITERITAYRGDPHDATDAARTVVTGDALLADLGALLERLSAAAELPWPDDAGTQWLSVNDLAARWRVSRRTLERYRRLGLRGRRFIAPDGRWRVLVSRAVADRFERDHGAELNNAGAYQRIPDDRARAIARAAVRYRRWLGWSIARACRRAAERFGVSPAAARRAVDRAEAARIQAGLRPLMGPPRPPHDRAARLAARAYRLGIEPRNIAARLARSPSSVHRLVLRHRVDLLRELLPIVRSEGPAPSGTAPTSSAAASTLPRTLAAALSRPGATADLGRPAPPTLADLIAEAHAAGWPDLRLERDRATARMALLTRADAAISRLHAPPPGPDGLAAAIDRAETDLRWAARLHAELVRSELLLLLNTARAQAGLGLDELPAPAAAGLLAAMLAALVDAVDRFDPSKGGRLAAPAGLLLNRAAARWLASPTGRAWAVKPPRQDHPAGRAAGADPAAPRAAAITDPSAVPVPDWTFACAPWQRWLEPLGGARIRAALPRARPADRLLIAARFGWPTAPPQPTATPDPTTPRDQIGDAGPPRTIVELAQQRGIPARSLRRLERSALQRLAALARDNDQRPPLSQPASPAPALAGPVPHPLPNPLPTPPTRPGGRANP